MGSPEPSPIFQGTQQRRRIRKGLVRQNPPDLQLRIDAPAPRAGMASRDETVAEDHRGVALFDRGVGLDRRISLHETLEPGCGSSDKLTARLPDGAPSTMTSSNA